MSAKFENNNLIVLNPVSKQELKTIPISSNEDVNKIIKKSNLDNSWSLLSVSKRASLIKVFRKALAKNKISIQNVKLALVFLFSVAN